MLPRYAETGEYGRNLMAQTKMIEQKYGNGRNRSLNILSKKSSNFGLLDHWGRRIMAKETNLMDKLPEVHLRHPVGDPW